MGGEGTNGGEIMEGGVRGGEKEGEDGVEEGEGDGRRKSERGLDNGIVGLGYKGGGEGVDRGSVGEKSDKG